MKIGRSLARHSYACGILVVLGACGSESMLPDGIDDSEPGAMSGELALYIADFEDGTTERRYALRSAQGDEQPLVFREPPNVEPGARVHVWGKRTGDSIYVDTIKIARQRDPSWIESQIGSQSSALINQPENAPRVECPVLVRINGGDAGNITLESISAQFHTGPKSVNAFYVENSYGKDSIVGKTYGPFDYPMTGCDYNGLAKALTPMIPASEGCKQYGWVMVPSQKSCSWSGLASGGTPSKPARDTWFNNSIGCVVTVQEPGHNYGLDHSSTLTCPDGWFSDSLAACKHNEYGDRFDPMGGGCRHMNVWQKQYQRWLGQCNAIKVTSSGSFNLLPMEKACDGVQSIQLPFPGGKIRNLARPSGGGDASGMDPIAAYFLEYRTSSGIFDTGMTPQVLVHIGLEPPNPATGPTRFGPHVWLLDASANAKAGAIGPQPGMIAGGSFTDPAGGLKVTVTSIDAEKAVIQVEYDQGTAAPTCMDSTALTPPGPTTCAGTVSIGDAGVVTPPATGTGGATGAGGARDGGRSTGGSAGSSSDAGVSGTGGQAGTGGGTAGAGVTSGSNTTSSAVGAGGAATASGSGGAPIPTTTTGSGGIGGASGNPPPRTAPGDFVGGCACRVGAGPSTDGRAAWWILGIGALVRGRRRHRKR